MQILNDAERIKRFDSNFAKLKHNREKVPLSELQGKYGNAYNALVAEVVADADWYADAYVGALAFPYSLTDVDGINQQFELFAAIREQEMQPGGARDQWRAALVDELNREKYKKILFMRYLRRLEAFAPYWNRHTVERSDGRTYNDIIDMCWNEEWHYWSSEDGKQTFHRFPPKITEAEWKEQ